MPAPAPELTAAETAAFRDDGFVVIGDALLPAEIDALRTAESSPGIQTALAEAGLADRTLHLLELTTRHPAFLALAQDSRIVRRLEASWQPSSPGREMGPISQ